MSEKLRSCTSEEIENLRRIVNQGFIDSDEDWKIYKKFIEIKHELIAEEPKQ